MKRAILLLLCISSMYAFSQESQEPTNHKIGVELHIGKIFSPYRFYKNHQGYEHLSLGLTKNITGQFGVLFSQSYGRLFSERTNNRTIVTTTIIAPYVLFFPEKKTNLRISLGTGLLHLHSKCLYDIYPVSEHIYGMPIDGNIAVFYKLSDKLSVNVNFDAHYDFLFNGDYQLLIDDPYYYKTFFYSTNIGVRYTFGKKSE